MHLSIFTHFCEAFLGIIPHFHLFQHFFILVPVPNASKPVVVGRCELILHPETRDEYLAYDPAGKGLEWKKFWFDVGNFESPLPERVPDEDKQKCFKNLDEIAKKKKGKQEHEKEVRKNVQIAIGEDEVIEVLALLKYPFYPLFILDNGMNSISKSLTVLTPA